MESLNKLKEMLHCEIDKIADQGEITAGSLESVGKLLDAIKDIEEIEMSEGEKGYSQRGYGGQIMYYPNDMYYDNGGSARGMNRRSGRYYRGNMNSYRGMNSYADSKDQMLDQLQEMMDTAMSDKERQAIQKCMRQIEQS